MRLARSLILTVMSTPPFLFLPSGGGTSAATAWLMVLLALAQAACLPSTSPLERLRHGGCRHEHEVARYFDGVVEVPLWLLG